MNFESLCSIGGGSCCPLIWMCHTNGFDPLWPFVCHSIETAKRETQMFGNALKIRLPASAGGGKAKEVEVMYPRRYRGISLENPKIPGAYCYKGYKFSGESIKSSLLILSFVIFDSRVLGLMFNNSAAPPAPRIRPFAFFRKEVMYSLSVCC